MFKFRKLCKQCEQLDAETASALFTEKSVHVISALSAITKDGKTGLTMYLDFILCSIASDGKLEEAEFEMIRPLLEKAADCPLTYEDAQEIFDAAGLDNPTEYKNAIDAIVDLIGSFSMELKLDIITICLLVCAVDGKISRKEKKWIKQLIA